LDLNQISSSAGNPANKIFMLDYLSIGASWAFWSHANPDDPSFGYDIFGENVAAGLDRVAYRHNGNANAVFFDGHAASMNAGQLWAGGPGTSTGQQAEAKYWTLGPN
jgi:prepilin-type processing-associated H-X9-DG protein